MDPDDISESDAVLPDEEDLEDSEVLKVETGDDEDDDSEDDDDTVKEIDGLGIDKDDTEYNPADY